MQKTQKKSSLVRKAKLLFAQTPETIALHDLYFAFADEPKVVQSYTMYSLGEIPILNFNPPQQ